MSPSLSRPHDIAETLRTEAEILLVLDFDGTLAEITTHPNDAMLITGAAAIIRRLATCTAIAISSGRSLEDLVDRLGSDLPATLVAGHGATVRHADGTLKHLLVTGPATATLDAVATEIAAQIAGHPGWSIERKPTSIAAHYRRADDDATSMILPKVRAAMQRHLTAGPGFEILEGKKVVEMRPTATNKGKAVVYLTGLFEGHVPVAIGDDVTDEDAFVAAQAAGGYGIAVGAGLSQTAARWRLKDPSAVIELLDRLAETRSSPTIDAACRQTPSVGSVESDRMPPG